MSALLAAGAVLLGAAAIWELAGSLEGRAARAASSLAARARRLTSLGDASIGLGLPGRIGRAGLSRRLDPGSLIAIKAAGALGGGLVAALAVPALPGRLAVPLAAAMVAAGFLAPDALLERAARRRRSRAIAALPEVLDMLAVGAASGRDPATVFAELAEASSGPLSVELAGAVAEIEAGRAPRDALAALRTRIPGPEIGALAAALERSRSYGSPLAEQLHRQASALRREARRRIEERAARAAPKIQLVVALVLVPSVLLMILAAIIAHSDALFGSLGAG